MTNREMYDDHRRRHPNLYRDSEPLSAISQRLVQDDSLEATSDKKGHSGIVHLRVVSYRKRTIDPDNLVAKFHVDCLRYGGFIKNDRAEDITIEVIQKKVKLKSDERTEIQIIPVAVS